MRDNKPRVSIGMPVYNGEQFLKEALDSILAQTFEDFELIISDNGSTDGTQEICQIYAARDRRIQYHRNDQNFGLAWNFNRVFELSRGEYFRWAAHDDVCAPECIERCLEVLEQDASVVLCYPRTKLINELGEILDENCDDNLRTDSPKPQERFHDLISVEPHRCLQLFGLIRASTLAMTPLHGKYSDSDRVLLVRLALLGRFHEVPEYLFLNREHPQRSIRALPSPYLRTALFDPAKEGKLVFPTWNIFFAYFTSIRHTPLSRYDQIYCYLHMAIWLKKHWLAMVKEVLKATVWPIYLATHRRALVEKNKVEMTKV